MNPIPFIILGAVVVVMPFLGFPPGTEDILIAITGAVIALWAALALFRQRRRVRTSEQPPERSEESNFVS